MSTINSEERGVKRTQNSKLKANNIVRSEEEERRVGDGV